MRFSTLAAPLAIALAGITAANAGPIAYGTCQTGCNSVAVACYAAAGYVFGTIAAVAAPPAIVACNKALGVCSAACAATALGAPIP